MPIPRVPGRLAAAGGTPLPAHVYAPYFETWATDSMTTIAQQSGARYLAAATASARRRRTLG